MDATLPPGLLVGEKVIVYVEFNGMLLKIPGFARDVSIASTGDGDVELSMTVFGNEGLSVALSMDVFENEEEMHTSRVWECDMCGHVNNQG